MSINIMQKHNVNVIGSGDTSLARYAEDVLAIYTALGLKDTISVRHSIGHLPHFSSPDGVTSEIWDFVADRQN